MKHLKKRIISILLVAVMAISLMACGDKTGTVNEVQSNDGQSNEVQPNGGEEKEALTTIKLLSKRTTLGSDQSNVDISTFDSDDSYCMYNEYKKRIAEVGVTLEVETVENEQLDTVISTRLASGKDLPDFINMDNFSAVDINKFGEDGIIVDYLDLFKKYDEDGSIVAFLNEYFPDFLPCASTEDGKLYTIPWLNADKWVGTDDDFEFTGNALGILIRGDWLEKVGIEYKPIVTTDEFKQIMVAFREKDANGNGVEDEVIALDPTQLGWSKGLSFPFGFNKFVTYNADRQKLSCLWYEKEAAKAYITWVQELIDAELFDMSIVGSKDVASTLLTGNRAGAVGDMLTAPWLDPQVPDENACYLPIIISSDYGTYTNANGRHLSYNGGYAVPANCDHLEAVVKFLDFYFTYDDTIWRRYGIDGDFSKVDETGYWTILPAEEQTGVALIPNLGQIEDAGGIFRTSIATKKRSDYVEYTTNEIHNGFLAQVFDRSIDFEILDNDIPMASLTSKEMEKLSEIENDLKSYMEEVLAKLILKQYSLDEFDEYVAEMDGLGLKEYVDIYQARIDRYNK